MTTFVADGNHYLYRAFSVSAKRRALKDLPKNSLDLFLKFVCSDFVAHKASHLLVTFDSKRSWRHDVYPQYKANRNKGAIEVTTMKGDTVVLDITPGSLVKDAKLLCRAAGLPFASVKGQEGDDLIGCVCASVPGRIIIGTRDKDMASQVTDRIFQYWPSEKKLLTEKDVFKIFGVAPKHIPEYLALLGDKVDNIPGIEGVGSKTAAKWLNKYGSIREAIKNDPAVAKKLRPHKSQLAMALKLTTLNRSIKFRLEELVPQPMNAEVLSDKVWSIPPALKTLSEFREYSKKKGLYG